MDITSDSITSTYFIFMDQRIPVNSTTVILILIGILLLNFLVRLSGSALDNISLSKLRAMLEDENDHIAKRIAGLVEKPSVYRYTNRILNYLIVGAGSFLSCFLTENGILSLVIFLCVSVTLTEIFPRKIARQHAEGLSRTFSGFQSFLCTILAPIRWILVMVANILLRMFRQRTDVDEKEFSEEEIMSMLEGGQESGVLREEGKKMIGNIFQFDDELAYEIMTPRTDVFMIDIEDPPDEYVDQLMELRYTRMPVCEGDSDNIIGILHIKDYLIRAKDAGFDKVDIKDILRKPYFVPDTKKIDTLFFELQKEKQHIAILIDEYGGFSGIVTLEDIIEEIVGDIDDEYDEEDEIIERIDDDNYLIDGNVDLDDLNEELGTDLESETSETIGGYLIDLIGEIPRDGYVNRQIEVDHYVFTILSVKERRIEKVKLFIDREEHKDENKKDEENSSGEER